MVWWYSCGILPETEPVSEFFERIKQFVWKKHKWWNNFTGWIWREMFQLKSQVCRNIWQESGILQSGNPSYLRVPLCVHVNQGAAQRCTDLWQLWPRNMFSNQAPQRLARAPELVSTGRLHDNGNLGVKEWKEIAKKQNKTIYTIIGRTWPVWQSTSDGT